MCKYELIFKNYLQLSSKHMYEQLCHWKLLIQETSQVQSTVSSFEREKSNYVQCVHVLNPQLRAIGQVGGGVNFGDV